MAKTRPQKQLDCSDLLTEDEIERIILAVAKGQPGGFTDVDATKAIKWAAGIRLMNHTLDFVLQGKLVIDVRKKNIRFATEDGK